MLKLAAPVAVLVVLGMLAAMADRPLPRADFTYSERAEITTLDPTTISWLQDMRVGRALYEGLLRNDPFTHEQRLVPAVASEMPRRSADGLTYTFRLRPDAKWSTGEPVRASDFVYAWRRNMLPDYAPDFIAFFHLIEGAEDFTRFRTEQLRAFASSVESPDGVPRAERARRLWRDATHRFAETVGVRAVGEHELEVRLARPVPYFLDLVAFPAFFPLCERVVSAYERPDDRTGTLKLDPDWARPGNHAANGPYVLARWRFKRDLRLEANPHYHDAASVSSRSIGIVCVEDANAQVLAFRTGAVDWATDVLVPYRAEMLADKARFREAHRASVEAMRARGLSEPQIDATLPPDPRSHIHEFPAFGTYFLNFNCSPSLPDGRPNPFADARVRRAFALASDKAEIVRQVRRTGEPIAGSLTPPGSIAGYEPPEGLAFDAEAARRLLARAGFPGGQSFPSVEFLFNKDAGHDLIAQSLTRTWQRVLGVRVGLAMKEVKVFREDVKSANYAVCRASWFGDYPDPTTFLDVNRSGNGNNDRRYANPAYDALLDRAEREPDPAARMALLREAERIIVEEDCPVVPIFHYTVFFLYDARRVAGVSAHPRQIHLPMFFDILGDGVGHDRPRFLPHRP